MKMFFFAIFLTGVALNNCNITYAETLAARLNNDDFIVAGISIGMPVNDAMKILGKPQSITTEVFNQRALKYIGFEIDSEDDAVFSIIITSNKYSTSRGLRVGDGFKRLVHLYGKPYSKDESVWTYKTGKPDKPIFSVVSKNNKVVRIYIGYYRESGMD